MAFSHIDCGVGDFMCGECQRAADEHTDAQQEPMDDVNARAAAALHAHALDAIDRLRLDEEREVETVIYRGGVS